MAKKNHLAKGGFGKYEYKDKFNLVWSGLPWSFS